MDICCVKCETIFKVQAYRKDKAKYCSYDCYWSAMKGVERIPDKIRIEIICLNCKKSKLLKPCKEGKAFYCSRKCHAEHVKKCSDRKSRKNYISSYDKEEASKKRDLHRKIMESILGYKLPFNMIVHHINGDTHDNRIENLEVMSRREHQQLHLKENYDKRHRK